LYDVIFEQSIIHVILVQCFFILIDLYALILRMGFAICGLKSCSVEQTHIDGPQSPQTADTGRPELADAGSQMEDLLEMFLQVAWYYGGPPLILIPYKPIL
jgi:hypothetical protein